MKSDSETMIEEARRQLANAQETYEQTNAARDDYLRIGKEQQACEQLLSILRGASIDLLLVGQGH